MGNAEKIIALLNDRQIPSLPAYLNRRMPQMEETIAVIGVEEQKLQPLAMPADHEAAQTYCCALLYEETVRLELYSPYLFGGNHCDRMAETILSALAQAFSTLSLSSVKREATYYDADTDCFRCRLTVVTKAYLTATE